MKALTLLVCLCIASVTATWGHHCPNHIALLRYRNDLRERRNTQAAITADFIDACRTERATSYWAEAIEGINPLPYLRDDVTGVTDSMDYYRHNPTATDSQGRPKGRGFQNVIGYFMGEYGPVNPSLRVSPGEMLESEPYHISCDNNICHVEFRQLTKDTASGFQTNFTHTGWLAFDADNKIAAIRTQVANFADRDFVDRPELGPVSVSRSELTQGLCYLITSALCTGNNQIFANVTDCIDNYNTLPLGSLTSGHRRTLICKLVHANLAGDQPEAHCGHLTMDGAGQCADVNFPDPTGAHPEYGPNFETEYLEALYAQADPNFYNPQYEACIDRISRLPFL